MHHKRRKPAILFALILLVSLLLSACSSEQSASGEGTEVLESNDTGSSGTGGQSSENTSDTEAAETPEISEEAEPETVYNIGSFTMEDINGESYTEAMFQDYELTMVNVFATWCSPCIAEIPYLEQLSQDMADSGVNVVGIVLDTADGEGGVDANALDAAKTLAQELGTTYPFLIPDAGLMNGLLTGIQSIPTTFFVDSEGNLTGYAYVGSRSLEDWTEIVNSELENLGEVE